jgi:polyphosphate kinase
VLDEKLKRRVIKEGLKAYLSDNCQAWEMDSDGNYELKTPRRARHCAQEDLLTELVGAA